MIKHQEGATGISIMIIVGALVFLVTILLKIVPVYVDDSSVKNVVASFHGKSDMRGQSNSEVLKTFEKRLKINNVTSLSDDAVTLEKANGDFVLTVEYEPRGSLIGSLDFIVSFKHEATFPAQ